MVLFCLSPTFGSAQENRPTESQVKAAYLYNFGKFVRWPEQSTPPRESVFKVCVWGKDPFDGALQAVVAGEKIGGSPLVVKFVNDGTAASRCQLLYISAAELRKFVQVLDGLRHLPVVTVSDAPDFLRLGGMIQFVLVNERVRFDVNLNAARDAGVQLSSELLKVATKVVGAPGNEGQQ